jgi:hypothetical protein
MEEDGAAEPQPQVNGCPKEFKASKTETQPRNTRNTRKSKIDRIMNKQNHLAGSTPWQKSKELHDCSKDKEIPGLEGLEIQCGIGRLEEFVLQAWW